MTDYIHVAVKKRDFTLRARLPNLSNTQTRIYWADDGLIDRNADVIIDRNADVIVCRFSVLGYPRSLKVKKRSLNVRAKVG